MKEVLLTVLLLFARMSNSATSIGRMGTSPLLVEEERYSRVKRSAGIPQNSFLWPSKNVPFVLEASISSTTNATLYKAFQHIRSRTCINFTPRSTEENYISITSSGGCFSFIGCLKRGAQPLSLGSGCQYLNIILMQLMNALGFYNEHVRSDRDDYVKIIYENIKPKFAQFYTKLHPSENRLLAEFDYESITLVGEKQYSKDGKAKTMISNKGNELVDIKMKNGLSKGDVAGIKYLYNCM